MKLFCNPKKPFDPQEHYDYTVRMLKEYTDEATPSPPDYVRPMLLGMLQVDPEQRWTAKAALFYLMKVGVIDPFPLPGTAHELNNDAVVASRAVRDTLQLEFIDSGRRLKPSEVGELPDDVCVAYWRNEHTKLKEAGVRRCSS